MHQNNIFLNTCMQTSMNRSHAVKTSVLRTHVADCSDTRLVAAAGWGFVFRIFDDAANASHTPRCSSVFLWVFMTPRFVKTTEMKEGCTSAYLPPPQCGGCSPGRQRAAGPRRPEEGVTGNRAESRSRLPIGSWGHLLPWCRRGWRVA